MTLNTTTTFEEIAAREDEFQLATYRKFPFALKRGRGAWVETSEGERYLDLYGGHAVAATGHCHPHVVEAIKAQSETLLFYSNLVYSDVRASAAEKLVRCAPAEITKAFFCNSGTEANENAMRMARMATGREGIITFTGSFHGRTADAISATEAIEADGMLANVRALEKHLRERLAGLPHVAALRGRGLLLGVEFTADIATKVQQSLLERHIITGTSSDARVLRLLPPLCLATGEAELLVSALKEIAV
ncbi:MAG: aminotransferase class III-fold pyridoxal phosphate-dependent enzyme [Acidobacteria bacterium]|nr:aminotransferase class III-fold pyridoxal phosphate-dependent enzyme [Acidobacteriota bacterium]